MLVLAQGQNPLLKPNYEQILICYICYSVSYMVKFIRKPTLCLGIGRISNNENTYPTPCQTHHKRKTLSQLLSLNSQDWEG